MNRTEAHEFLKSYIRFMHEAADYVQIVDCDPGNDTVELKVYGPNGGTSQRWVDLWTAAKIIEANSDEAWPFKPQSPIADAGEIADYGKPPARHQYMRIR